MEFYIYILYSSALDQYYVGHTEDLQNRLFRHNNSGSKSTKKASDWVLKYQETYPTRTAAMGRGNGDQEKEKQKIY